MKNHHSRRPLSILLAIARALLVWLAPEVTAGVALLAAGIILEITGIMLERRGR